jgi:hypothetical protein
MIDRGVRLRGTSWSEYRLGDNPTPLATTIIVEVTHVYRLAHRIIYPHIQAIDECPSAFFSVRFIIAIAIGLELLVPSVSLGQENVPDLFRDKPLVAYVVWPCIPEPELVIRDRFVSTFDVLGLRRPVEPDPWFITKPSWPYRFNPSAIDILKQRLEETQLISQKTISRGDDSWGKFLSFRLDKFPNFEIKRYPIFLVIVANRLQNPVASKSEYHDLHAKLGAALQMILFEEPVLGKVIQALQEPFALINRPLIRATHLEHLEPSSSFPFIGNLLSKKFRSSDDLVRMGVLPNVYYSYEADGLSSFVAKNNFSESVLIILPTRPPVIPERYHWTLVNYNIYLERLIRFVLLINVVVPDYVREAENTSCNEALRLVASLRDAPGNLREIRGQFEHQLDTLQELVRSIRGLRQSLENATQVLAYILTLSDAVDEASRSLINERFRQTHGEQIRRVELWPNYVRLALRFRSDSPTYDTERALRDAIRTLNIEAGRIESCTQSTETRFDRAIGILSIEKSLVATRWAVWLAIVALLVSTVAGLYPKKSRLFINGIYGVLGLMCSHLCQLAGILWSRYRLVTSTMSPREPHLYGFHSEEDLVDTITAENSITADFFLGVDGRDGAGKTTLTRYLAEKIGASVISLDEFIEKNKDAYMSSIRFSDLKRAIAQASGPVIIEGACLLAALQRLDICLSRLVYVKRMISDVGWFDEKICDPPDDVEAFLARIIHEFAQNVRDPQ